MENVLLAIGKLFVFWPSSAWHCVILVDQVDQWSKVG